MASIRDKIRDFVAQFTRQKTVAPKPDEPRVTTPIQDMTDKEVVARVMADYGQAYQHKLQTNERARRYLNIYKALDPPDELMRTREESGQIEEDEAINPNTYLPVGAAIVKAGVSLLTNILFRSPDLMRIAAQEMEDAFFEERITGHLRTRLKEMKAKTTIKQALLQAGCFDYAVTCTRWFVKGGFQPQRETIESTRIIGGVPIRERSVKMKPVWVPDKIDRSDLVNLNFFYCFPDWTSINDLEGSRFFIDIDWIPIEQLLERSGNANPWGSYQNVDTIIGKVLSSMPDVTDFDPSHEDISLREQLQARRVKRIRYWTENHVVEVCEGEVLRRLDLCGWPLQVWSIFDLPNTFGGMGWCQGLERIQVDINASLNARRSYENLVSNPFGVISRELVGAGSPRMYAGRWVTTSGDATNKMAFYSPGLNALPNTLTDIQIQTQMAERQAQISPAAMAALSTAGVTATEVREVAGGETQAAMGIAEKLETNCLEAIYLNLFMLEAFFLTRKERLRYFGTHGEVLDVVDAASYMWGSMPRFQALGTVATSDAVERAQFQSAIVVALQMPMVKHNWPNIAKEFWRLHHPKEFWKFVQDPDQPTHNVPANLENVLAGMGIRPEVSPLNDHAEHRAAHTAYQQSADYATWPASRRQILLDHIQEHEMSNAPAPQTTMLNAMRMQDQADTLRGLRPTAITGVPR